MGDATSSSENDASSGEGPNAKRCRRDPDAPKPDKGVVVLLDSDVSVSLNGQVPLPNTIEMAKLKKPEKGQYCRINFTSKMTEKEVLSTLHSKFSIIKNKRLGCASATKGRLDFHGRKRIWNGAEIKNFAQGHSALYLFAEDNHEYEDSQVLTGGTDPVAAARPLNVHTSVAGPSTCDQKEPVLNVQTQQEEFGMISIPQHQQCLGQDMTARKWTVPQRSFLQQRSTVSTSKKQKNGTYSYVVVSGNPGIGKSILKFPLTKIQATSRGKSGLRVEGLASEQSVNEDSMTTPVQHHGQIELGGKTTTRESALKQSMPTSVAQASVLAATQRLKELSQVHVSVSSTADQRHVTGMGSTLKFAAAVSNANHEGEPVMLQRGKEDLTSQPDHTIDDILQQGLSVVQKRPNGPIVQATVDPAAQESLNPVSVTCKQRELIAQTSEQGSSLQQSPAVAAAHTNVPAKGFFSETTSAKKLPVSTRKRKSHPNGHQEFPALVAVSEGETTDSGIDSLLENESNHDTDQLRDIVLEISPSKGSTKGGDKFHIILQDICPLEIESFVAVFQFRETEQVHLKPTNLFTYTGITPKSLQGPGPVNVTFMSLDGSWWGGEAEFEYIDEDEEYLRMVVTNKDKRRKLFDRLDEELSNKQSDRQTSNSPGKTGPGLSSLNQSRCAWSVKLLQLLVYKAAEVGGQEFIQMIFSTSAGKVVFDSYRNIATLPEDVARVNGHSALADYLQDVNISLSKESNSAGTEGIDWLELKHAVDKEQSLTSGTDDAQISKKCQPPGYPESDDDENDYFADDEMSPCSSPSYTNLRDSENEDHSQNTNMIESSCEKEVNGENNLSVENNDSSEFPLHLVGNQLEDITSMKPKSAGYKHKQLDSDDVESYSSGDDITEKEYDSAVPCRDEVENWETVESEVIPAIKETSARTTSSRNATHESGLDGDQKELRMTNNDETSRSRVIEFLRKKEEYKEVNIPTENKDLSVFYPHLKVIPSIQGVNDGYEHKQLDYEEVESHRSEDDMHENENVYRVFKTDQNELNKITIPSGKRTTQLYPAVPSISSYRETDDVVVTDVSEWGLDGHQKELRMTVNDETTRSRGSQEETPCDAAVVRNLESPFSRTIGTVMKRSFEKEVNGENLSVENNDSSEFPLHLVGNQLEVILSMRAESSGYEHKHLESDDIESYSSGDDITEKEYESTVLCRDEVENWDTFRSEVMFAIKEACTETTSSHNATHESDLDGDQKELRMRDNAEASISRVIEFLTKKEVNEVVYIPRNYQELLYSHLQVIPPIQDVNAAYEHKQLDYEEVESPKSEDHMHEKEYAYNGFITDQNDLNKITVPSGKRTTNSHTSALHSISSHRDTDDVVATNGSEWGLDGDQKELRIIDNDETTRSRGSRGETPCDEVVMRNLESPFSRTIKTDANRDTASPSSLDYTEADSDRKGDSATGPREQEGKTDDIQKLWNKIMVCCVVRWFVKRTSQDLSPSITVASSQDAPTKGNQEKAGSALSVTVFGREAERRPGYNDPLDWLSFPLDDLTNDIIVSHGGKLGKQAYIIRKSHTCKWVQVLHTAPEELGMYKNYPKAISKCEEKSRIEMEFCELADVVAAVGPKLTEVYFSILCFCKKRQDIIQLTPATFSELFDSKQAANERNKFKVLIFGRSDPEDFSLKGYDIAAKAIVELKDSSYDLVSVGAPDGKQEDVAENLLRGIHRRYVQIRERLEELRSRTEGFGITSLEVISAGLPILVSGNSGFGDALCTLPLGKPFTVVSADQWAEEICGALLKARVARLQEIPRISHKEMFSLWEAFHENVVWSLVHVRRDAAERRKWELTERAHDLDRLFLHDPVFERLHQTLNEAKLNFQATVSFSHRSSCQFLIAANSKTALHVEDLGRARALAELMIARYSIESQISCKLHSWTYLDEIMKKERSSTCLYISCHGQDVFLSILKTSGAISLRKVKVGNNFLHDKLATNLDAVFAIMANSVLSEEDCNKQSIHDIEPKLDSSQILSSCYKLLIDPVSGLLEKPSIIIVPKDSLCLVPFAALLNDESGMYLSDTFRIRVVPSLTTLKLIQDSPADYHSQTGALVVGDPTVGEVIYRGSVSSKFVPLPGARKEAEMVGRLLGVQPLLGQNATKQAILQMLHSVSLIHIAAHGSADRGEIALAPPVPTSGILQEDDYLLKLSDISEVQLRAKLVVLSCCHSGRGQVRSEGIIGMAQAFLGSGARSVLVALGALNDRATEQLMCHFYEHLVRGESASESLHQAMKWMRGNGFTKVSDWAPFTLIGDDVTFDFRE